jgi:TfoX/Sxy family transcriptional regulator of competence genes
MAYDEGLADRVRSIFRERGASFERSVFEKRMFGGLVFMIDGNMCCGVRNRELMLRLGPDEADAALERPHTRPVDPSRKRIRSLIFVREEGIDLDRDLEEWVEIAVKFVRTLQPKAPSEKPRRRVLREANEPAAKKRVSTKQRARRSVG